MLAKIGIGIALLLLVLVAVWCALALYPVVRRRWPRMLVAAYPVVTTLVVAATGNHFFLDALAGTLAAVGALPATSAAGPSLGQLNQQLGQQQARQQQIQSRLGGLSQLITSLTQQIDGLLRPYLAPTRDDVPDGAAPVHVTLRAFRRPDAP